MLSRHVQCAVVYRFQKTSHEPAAMCTILRESEGDRRLPTTRRSQIAMTPLM